MIYRAEYIIGIAFALFQLAIFLGAALLFQIQPLVVKRILPWFGATSSCWTTSVMFFHIALVFGYLYAPVGRPPSALGSQFATNRSPDLQPRVPAGVSVRALETSTS